jgi:hypothetical protein
MEPADLSNRAANDNPLAVEEQGIGNERIGRGRVALEYLSGSRCRDEKSDERQAENPTQAVCVLLA